MLNRFLWSIVARLAARYWRWIYARAEHTPYTHIGSADGRDVYMYRYWLFNAYAKDHQGRETAKYGRWLPSVRLHHIMRPDRDRDLHDHPWNARTCILDGWYHEVRERPRGQWGDDGLFFVRKAGDTARLLHGEYHRITAVSPGGVVTLFFTWRYRGTWGFKVNGVKVPWRDYLAARNMPEAG